MKTLPLLLFSFLFISQSFAQSLDFGLDVKLNRNNFLNRYGNTDQNINLGYFENNPNELIIPSSNFTFLDDNGDPLSVRFDDVRVANNFEVPIYLRYNTGSNFFIELSYSSARYRLDYSGRAFRDAAYYNDTYGTFSELNGSFTQFEDTPINESSSETYSQSEAYINWFNAQVQDDPYTSLRPQMSEEFQFNSIYVMFGRKFLRHKKLRPFFSLGLGYRFGSRRFTFKHFELDDQENSQAFIRQNLTQLTKSIPTFSNHSIGLRLGLGAELYRYHFGAIFDFALNLSSSFRDRPELVEYVNTGFGIGSASIFLGVDLVTVDLDAEKFQDDVYEDEYQAMSQAVKKRRMMGLSVKVKSPFVSRVNSADPFTFISMKDQLDTTTTLVNKDWQSLTFKEISRVRWNPRIEIGYRFNTLRWLDVELHGVWTNYKIDTKVEELNTTLIADTTVAGGFRLDPFGTTVNSAVHRSDQGGLGLGLNLYFHLLDNGYASMRAYAGVTGMLIGSAQPGPGREFGVNGDGKDVYNDFNQWYWGNPDREANTSWHSSYASDIDLTQSDNQIIDNYKSSNWRSTVEYKGERTFSTMTTQFGLELEIDKILLGASGEFTINGVDNVLIRNYWNFNLSLGYMLFSNYKKDKRK